MSHNKFKDKRILIVDDHELFRVGLRLILESEIEVDIIEIEKISDIVSQKVNVDVVLLDICLPGINGINGMSIIQRKWPNARIMLLSANSYHQEINTALNSGASCFLNKNSAPSIIINIIKSLLNKRTLKANKSSTHLNPLINNPKTILSSRLLEVLNLVSEGKSNKEVADELCISEHTVRNHIAFLMNHFAVHNRTRIIIEAQRAGYLS